MKKQLLQNKMKTQVDIRREAFLLSYIFGHIKKAAESQKERGYTRIFVVKESFAGTKKLTDILADLLYSAYCKQESENKETA